MTPADFRAAMTPAFDDLVAYPDPLITQAIAASATYVGATEWDTTYGEALNLWVAWRVELMKSLAVPGVGSGAGDETMEMVGRMQFMRDPEAVAAEMADPYRRNRWGQMFVALRDQTFGGTTLATGCVF
jgi:Protein of unknown function (DUF4054)